MPRTVGSIEVIVDADTRRLKAKLVTESTKAGKAGAKAMEKELSRVQAKISKITLDEAGVAETARKLRELMQAAVRGVDVTLDTAEARKTLRAYQAEVDAEQLALHATISEEDLGKITARLKKMEAETHDLHFNLTERDLAEMNARLDAFVNERRDAKVQVDADLATINTKIEAFTKQEREAKVRLQIEFQRATAEYDTWLREQNRKELLLDVGVNTRSANEGVREFAAKLKFEQVDLNVGADLSEALDEVAFVQTAIEHDDTTIPVGADTTAARVAIMVLRELVEHNKINLPVGVDLDQMDLMLTKMEVDAATGGDEAGKAFSKGFSGSSGKGFSLLPNQFTEWLPLIGLALQPLGPLIQGIAGGATQILSSAFSALGGAAGAAAPLVAGLAGSLGAVAIASAGVGKGISAVAKEFAAAQDEGRKFDINAKGIQKAMGALGPAAQGVVKEFAGIFPQLKAFQNVIAERVFAGLGDQLKSLSTETLPDIGTAFALAGDSANKFAKGIIAQVEGIDFTGTFLALQPALDSLGQAIANVIGSIEPFLKAAAPAAKELADWLSAGAASLTDAVKAGAASGGITKFLTEGVDSLKQWASLIGNVAKAMFTLFQAGKEGGDGMVSSITDVVKKFDAWMKSMQGQRALAHFFDTSREILKDLGPLITGLAKGIKNIVTASTESSFKDLTKDLGDVLPVVGDLIGLLSRVNFTGTIVKALKVFADALEPVMDDLKELADNLGKDLADALKLVTPMIEGLARFIGTLAETFNDLPGPIQDVVIALGALFLMRDKVGGLGKSIAGLQENITKLPAAAGQAKTALGDIFKGTVGGGSEQVNKGFENLGKSLPQLAKSAGAAAGTAIATGLGIGFGAQMAIESDSMTGKVEGILAAIGSAATAFAVGGPIVGSIAVAIGAITTAVSLFGEKSEEARARTQKFTDAVIANSDAIIQSGKIAAGAAVGPQAFVDSLDPKAADSMRIALGTLNKDFIDTQGIVLSMGQDAKGTMTELAMSFGLPQDQAERLAALVNSTNENFQDWNNVDVHGFGNQLFDIANKAGMIPDNVRKAANALATTKDVTRDYGKAAQTAAEKTLLMAKSGSDQEKQALETATAMQASGKIVQGTVPLYNEYERQLNILINTQDKTTGSTDDMGTAADRAKALALEQAGAYEVLGGAEAQAAQRAADLAAAQFDAGRKAFDNREAQQALAETTAEVAASTAEALGMNEDLATGFENVGNAARVAADEASAFKSVIDLLIAPAGNVEEAMVNIAKSFEKFDELIHGGTEAINKRKEAAKELEARDKALADAARQQAEGDAKGAQSARDRAKEHQNAANEATAEANALEAAARSLDVNTKAGQENIGFMHQRADETFALIEAMLAQGAASGEIIAKEQELRAGMILQAQAFGKSQTEAEAYVNTLLGTPETLETIIKTPGLVDALTHTKDLTLLYDQAGNPVISEFLTLGLDPALANSKEFKELLDKLGATTVKPTVDPSGVSTATTDVEGVQTATENLDGTTAAPTIEIDPEAMVAVAAIQTGVDTLGETTADPVVTIAGMDAAMTQVNNLKNNLATLPKEIVINVAATGTQGSTSPNRGGRVTSMAGRMVTFPTVSTLGERGYREAVIPLDLPLNRVDPSVRDLAALLRGEGSKIVLPSGKTVNNYMTITPQAADPVVVANKIINRAAALAANF